jgi:type II secretory pathway component GspD/PulD (secretin)
MFRLRWACAFIAILLAVQFAPAKVGLATEKEEEIRQKLQRTVSLEFECEPLPDVLKFIAGFSGIDFQVDTNALKGLGKKECKGKRRQQKTIFVTVNVKDVTLESALNQILTRHGLGFHIGGGSVYVSSRKESGKKESQTAPASVASRARTEEEIRERLQQSVSLEFECEPLPDVLKFIAETFGIDFQVDIDELGKLGSKICNGKYQKRKAVFVTLKMDNYPLESTLERMLTEHGLTFYIKGESIYVTSKEKARNQTTQE